MMMMRFDAEPPLAAAAAAAAAAVITPVASREDSGAQEVSSAPREWLDRLLCGERFGDIDWQRWESTRTTTKGQHNDNNHYQAELLSESLLSAASSSTTTTYKLVRLVGMVQDMHEAEYIPITRGNTTTSTSRTSTTNSNNNNNPSWQAGRSAAAAGTELVERTPLVIVPMNRLLTTVATPTTTTDPSDSTSITGTHRSKRLKPLPLQPHDDEDATMDCDDNINATASSTTLDFVVAHFYYDQYPNNHDDTPPPQQQLKPQPQQRRLQLNQLVELVGVLEVVAVTDPKAGEESESSSPLSHTDGWRNDWPQIPVVGGGIHAMDCHTGSNIAEPSTFLPWTVPRLHVVWFQSVARLEDIDERIIENGENDENKEEKPENIQFASNTTDANNPAGPHWLSEALGCADQVTASAIWMLLQSQAERHEDSEKKKNAIVTPHETLLGCASLQVHFNFNDIDSHPSQRFHDVATTWASALQQLVPFVRVVDLSELTAPYQSSGRLHPNVLQLPAGSVLIVTCCSTPSQWRQQPWSLEQQRETLQQLCQGHRIQYRFDGGCRIAFEADYRVLVLTSGGSEHLSDLGCTLQVHCGPLNPRTVCSASQTQQQQLQSRELRRYLAHSRSLGNVRVLHHVLDRAQHDFLQRRATQRATTGEREFHQWLTLTRLHARSRASTEATLADWEAALELHQALRATMTANAGSPA